MKLLSSSALLVAASALHAQAVITVDNDGPADFSTIAAAVAAAPEGATILVRDGFYGEFHVGDKALVVTADLGASVRVIGTSSATNLAAGKTLVLHGLTFANGNISDVVAIGNCSGTVWIEDVTIEGTGFTLFSGTVALRIEDSVVVLSRTTVVGNNGIAPNLPGIIGLLATDSTLHLFETQVVGGRGGQDQQSSGVGGVGLSLQGGFLFAASSTIQGGQGGSAFLFGCNGQTSGMGGTGLVLNGGAEAHLLGSSLAGGSAGAASGPCPVGPAGVPFVINDGTLEAPAWPTHGFAVTSPVRVSQGSTASFSGVPGEFAWYLYSEESQALFLPQVLGTLVLDFPLFIVPVGVLDGQGEAQAPLAPALAPGVESLRFLLQSLFFDGASNSFTLSTPAVLVLLEDGV